MMKTSAEAASRTRRTVRAPDVSSSRSSFAPIWKSALGEYASGWATGSETRKELRHAMDAAGHHGCREVVRAGNDVGHDFSLLGIGDGGFEDADDSGGSTSQEAAAEKNGFAEDARIFPKSGGPETIGENDDAGRFGAIVLRPDETAKDRVEADYVEVVAADDAGLDLAGFTQADHGGTEGGEVTERGQGFYAGAQVLDFGHGECHVFVSDARSALADVDQPVLVAVDQRLEQHPAHQREDRSVGTDAQRQRQNHGDRKPFASSERVERNSQIAKKEHVLDPVLAVDIATHVPMLKHHILNHLVCDACVWDARFQDARVANSDTNARRVKVFDVAQAYRFRQAMCKPCSARPAA